MPTPNFHNGAILVGGENRGIRQVLPKLEGSTWNVEEGWHQKRVALDMSTAVVHGNHLFGFSHFELGQLFCMDTTSGDILWRGPSRTGENVCLLTMDNHIGALINNGTFLILEASTKAFQKIRSYKVASGPTWAPPVLWADSLLIKDRNHLTRWSFIE
jgi:outer membrane protein assembly factor BamB